MGPVFGYVLEAVIPGLFDKIHDPIYDKFFPNKRGRQSSVPPHQQQQQQHHHQDIVTRDSPRDYYEDEEDDRSRYGRSRRSSRSERKASKQRERDESPTFVRRMTDKHFDNTDRGMTRGAVGAVAGGLLGHALGKSGLATAAGAALGGLGANAYESHESRRRESRGGSERNSSRRPRSNDRDRDRDRDRYSRSRVGRSRDSSVRYSRDGYDNTHPRDGYESERYSRRSSRYEPKRVEFDDDHHSRASSRYGGSRMSDAGDQRYARRASVPEPRYSDRYGDMGHSGLVPARKFPQSSQQSRYQPDRRATVEDSFSDASNPAALRRASGVAESPHFHPPPGWT